VRVRYGGIEVLHGVGIAVPFGALTALVGPNGAGKSTLLGWCAAAASTATAAEGQLTLVRPASASDGGGSAVSEATASDVAAANVAASDASGWSATRRASHGLRLVPSGLNVFQRLTVADNLRATGDPAAALALFPELEPLLPQRAGTLSGGQRQLLAVAGALSGRWRVLLIDEPVQGIAPALAERVYEAIAAAVTPDHAVLAADPIAARALRVADFVWQLERGRVTFAGEPAELTARYSAEERLGRSHGA
jgi:branched-chain amino acid transport system ATP-binding protein